MLNNKNLRYEHKEKLQIKFHISPFRYISPTTLSPTQKSKANMAIVATIVSILY